MTNINIKLPDELHKKLRIIAAIRGISLKELVQEYLEKGSADDKELVGDLLKENEEKKS
ncbi:hypothetical protein JW968_06585 [Candidatus Woesearchaeota archaeon]|nr:hypothetical protein [Candidatus Woesearchaeota archaeon]